MLHHRACQQLECILHNILKPVTAFSCINIEVVAPFEFDLNVF